jgi:hypothetical protein
MAKKRQHKKDVKRWKTIDNELLALHMIKKGFNRPHEYLEVIRLMHMHESKLIRLVRKYLKSDDVSERAIGMLLKELLSLYHDIEL